jgi:serine O-acetyltransferase
VSAQPEPGGKAAGGAREGIEEIDNRVEAAGAYFNVMTLQRIAHRLHRRRIPLLPRLIELLAFLVFNSSIPATVEVGKGTGCAHRGVSVIIHRYAKIGSRVFIGMRVTIGGLAQKVGAPVIEDDVFIGINSIVLCSRVGRGAIIGAGSIVIDDVPPGAIVVGAPARQIGQRDRPYWQDSAETDPTMAAMSGAAHEGDG